MYENLAEFYDNPIRTLYSEDVLATTERLLQQHAVRQPGPLLDLATGTGILPLGLAQKGWRVTAIDLSTGMLDIARARAEQAGVAVQFECRDIRRYVATEPMAAVLCFGDVINHLLADDDVRATMNAAYRALDRGGLLAFDINTLDTFRSALWNTQLAHTGEDGNTISVVATFDPGTALGSLTHRVEFPSASERSPQQETMSERYYPIEVLQDWLREAGFELIACEPYNPVDLFAYYPDVKTFKMLCVAQRPAP